MSVTTPKQSVMPTADLQWRARRVARQASKLAGQAKPVTRRAAAGAKRGAGGATSWAKPQVGRARAWMAVRAAHGSTSVQENIGPKIADMLAATARRLDPPAPKSRRWLKVTAGVAVLAAGAAAAAAIALRKQSNKLPAPTPQREPSGGSSAQRSTLLNPNAQPRPMTESDVNGLSRTR
jgi:hypothetical protein